MLLLAFSSLISAVEEMPETWMFCADAKTKPWNAGESPGLLVMRTGVANEREITVCGYDPACTTISTPSVAAAIAWLRLAN